MDTKIKKSIKTLKVYAHHSKRDGIGMGIFVPEIKFSGLWLDAIGFKIGDDMTVTVENGKMILQAEGRKYAK
jgi:antitoxin component of MazEF toxin-antitoxin module